MELGLFVEPQLGGSYDRLVELAKWSEDNGLDAFARSDHYLHGETSAHATDAITSLAGVAVETSSIRLVTLVSPITFRHPAVMAKAATTLDEISHGRFTLGVGTGWMESEHEAFGMDLPPLGERFDRLAEALAYIRLIFDGGGSVEGKYYSLDTPSVSPQASDGLKIVIGGSGKRKTPTLAGRFADEYNLFVTDAATLVERVEVMHSAATAAGRNPDDILISMAGPGLVFDDDAEYQSLLVDRAAKRELSVDDYVAFLDERNVPHGSPERAHEAIQRMAELGVGRYYVQEFSSLEDVDLTRMELIFSALQGSA
ncbi:MAG: LLM class flavin-dependent oxidoreductase [Actinomycetota bacterium]|nr:LLM class flavin-dependent oxidoreductase [Actinomycetota bacterium]MDK1102902.1 LLM class flavin-dependent oxidoreductase [Actinomycetota bacterium]